MFIIVYPFPQIHPVMISFFTLTCINMMEVSFNLNAQFEKGILTSVYSIKSENI
jgi:tellurite resistance protein TehA-like permease